MNKQREADLTILILLLIGFAFGFIVGKGLYDNTPITRADIYEIEQAQPYE
jgi:hypothetical protein